MEQEGKAPGAAGQPGGGPSRKCRICHRPLTDPASVKIGMGPVCAGGLRKKPKQLDLFGGLDAQ